MKFSKKHYDLMGKIIRVTHELIFDYRRYIDFYKNNVEYGLRQSKVKRLSSPRDGWVVGLKYKREGKIFDNLYKHTQFVVTRTVPVLQVVYWPSYNPVDVPLDGYNLIDDGHPYCNKRTWTDNEKHNLRCVMEDQPRDKHGRWK